MIGLGLGGIYLLSTQAMDEGDTMVYLQRQGTLIQEELTRLIQRATVLEVDAYGAGQSLCQPEGGVDLPAGKSIIYQRTVATTGSPTDPSSHEYWCAYEYKRPADAYAQLWLCQVSGLTPPQTCLSPRQNLLATALRGFRGLAVGVSATCFRPSGLDPGMYPIASCIPATAPSPLPCPGCPASVEVSFALDVQRSATVSTSSVVGGPRRFAFNITIRN